MCFVVTCWERADLLALVCGVFCEFVTFPLVSWVRCGTWLYRFLIFAPLLTLLNRSASLAIQQAFSKPCLVNLISKDTHLGFSLNQCSARKAPFLDVSSVKPVAVSWDRLQKNECKFLIFSYPSVLNILRDTPKNPLIETGFRVHVPTACVSTSFVNYALFGTLDMCFLFNDMTEDK